MDSSFIKQEQPTMDSSSAFFPLEKRKNTEDSVDNLLTKKSKFEQSRGLPVHPEVIQAQPIRSIRNPIDNIPSACKQFWKAGDYEGGNIDGRFIDSYSAVGMEHVRVHPRFLHSNATSHKWALGAFAELLDNALDEVCYGATYVHVDVVKNRKDGSSMLLIEDNGGGMDPDKMRACMSLGYSVKSKMANTIGQYGNGFKTSTMRLGADVIVFSRSKGKGQNDATQNIGMLSYSFLRGTGKEDIVVPMIDYTQTEDGWTKLIRNSADDWNRNLETIVNWSPFSSEDNLLQQFNMLKDQGTRIVIYNLWEDDERKLELDFEVDPHDIQIGGASRDEKNIEMAIKYPNSRHFLTYQHSLRSYASILYLRLPPEFRIILRGKDVEHHNIVNDMMHSETIVYTPSQAGDGRRNTNMVAYVTHGFVKDAVYHIDVQGFNVYHKNRLIKPFWRIWNAAGSDGRGVIGVLEADFVEPAHDKQGFERTTVLARLECRLKQIQKNYWSQNCHLIGYAARRQEHLASNISSQQPNQTSRKTVHTSTVSVRASNVNSNSGNRIVNENSHMRAYVPPNQAPTLHQTPNMEVPAIINPENQNLIVRVDELESELQKEKKKSRELETMLELAHKKIQELETKVEVFDKEQATLIELIVEDHVRRDDESKEKTK
ncbi:hypothetical protein ACFE04_023333 [Oxalis oulophora]